mgnify:CR=1 FL=1
MDRRGFLEGLALTTLAGACQVREPAGTKATAAGEGGASDAGAAAPSVPPPIATLRGAVVPDDLEPAMSFRPLPPPGRR